MKNGEQVRHPIFARIYMRMSRKRHETEDEHRRKLLAGLSGQVIEVGAGNGLNFSLPGQSKRCWPSSPSRC